MCHTSTWPGNQSASLGTFDVVIHGVLDDYQGKTFKIKQGVSADKILDDIRDNIHGDTLQRHNLLDKKDILNI